MIGDYREKCREHKEVCHGTRSKDTVCATAHFARSGFSKSEPMLSRGCRFSSATLTRKQIVF